MTKRIPVAGGLGGGSSDAAAALLGLQELTGIHLPEAELHRIGRGLGSDVPFFLLRKPWALGRGRGDELEPLEAELRLWHLLVAPGFPIPTKAVYGAFTLTAPGPDVMLFQRALRQRRLDEIRRLLFNALEPTVEHLYPAIRRVKERIREAGLTSPIVSGSGSTVMALCSCREEAEQAARQLRRRQPGWGVFVASTQL